MADRYSDIRDHHDIAAVLIRYATGIDRRDWALFETVFTVDCRLDYGEIGTFHGSAEITDFMNRSHAMAGHTQHRLTNIAIAAHGDRAETRCYVDALVLGPDNGAGVNAIGFYDDELIRTTAGWQIARRRFTAVRVSPVGPA